MSGAAAADAGAGKPFLERLSVEAARLAFLAWQAARAARSRDGLPELRDFAPHDLPRETLPWVLIHHERPDGEIVYGVVGEELSYLFRGNPRGQPVLAYATPEERKQRLAVIREAMHSARPVWFTGTLLFENKETVPVGRLGLPARSGADRVLLLIYFLLAEFPEGRPRPLGGGSFDPRDVVWCPVEEIALPSPAAGCGGEVA